MHKLTQLPDELGFLREMCGDRNRQFRQPYWLQGDFQSECWRCDFGKGTRFDIDFRIKLEDGSLLTTPKHAPLLETIKCWLGVQTHFDATGGRLLSAARAYVRVRSTLHLIDYFLLHSARFQLAKYGLLRITSNELLGLMIDLASSNEVTNSVYRWHDRLAAFLRSELNESTLEYLDTVLADRPELSVIENDLDDRILDLTDSQLIYARALLWTKGFYIRASETGYCYSPSTEKLAANIYRDTLQGKSQKPVPTELCFLPIEHCAREYPAVAVRNNTGNQLTEQQLGRYKQILRTMGLLAEIGLPVPLSALRAADTTAIRQALRLKKAGRYRTLPQAVVFPALRNAIEFALEYGDAIVDSYLALVRASRSAGLNCQTYSTQYDITPLLVPKLAKFGVRTWSVALLMEMVERNPRGGIVRSENNAYFRRFRANEGLFELLHVLYGAVQICVGTLMARRQGELRDLVSGKCLDKSKTHLVFDNRKSGIEEMREKEARPIPPVAVKLIGQLDQLQAGLIELGVLKDATNLFRRPSRSGETLVQMSSPHFNRSLNFFCDYFQTPRNQNGERYYIRQHQLRRFFAMLFFWGKAFGGLETLSWFLGHTDIEHLYHYITESTPGAVLRSIKAGFATECVRTESNEANALADLLEEHFHTREFCVLDSEELDEYIEELMDDGKVRIEPEFFETRKGKDYRILIKVSRGEQK